MTYDLSKLLAQYNQLNLHEVIDHDKFNDFAIVHHSTSIEGSTLTEVETRLLLDEGITPKGKPLIHSLMVKDHYDALKFVLDSATAKQPITVEFIQQINARVMKTNDKVIPYTQELVKRLDQSLPNAQTEDEQFNLSFSAHFDLVSIHPFYDGNGRTSRLLMNYIQAYHGLPLAIVFKEDKADYYVALQETRKQEDMQIFYTFMFGQYQKHLEQEITSYNEAMSQKAEPKKGKGSGYSLFF